MLTPQEVQDKKFAKAVFGGYDMSEVDDFLDSVYADYASLYKENAILKNKLKVLVETVEEYRSVDEAMRKALLTAQRMAAEMTEEAKQKSTELVASAEVEAGRALEEVRRTTEREERRLRETQAEANRYADTMIALLHEQIALYSGLKLPLAPEPPASPPAENADAIAESIEQALMPEPPKPAVEAADAAETERARIIRVPRQQAPEGPLAAGPRHTAPAPEALEDDADTRVMNMPGGEAEPGFPESDAEGQTISVGGMDIQVYEVALGGEPRGELFDDEEN